MKKPTIPRLPFRFIHIELTRPTLRLIYFYPKWEVSGYRGELTQFRNVVNRGATLREVKTLLDADPYVVSTTQITILDGGRRIPVLTDEDWVMLILGESPS
jgi:hypothetical protein